MPAEAADAVTPSGDSPDWADEAHLDEVFSDWVPGPHESAPAAEREMAGNGLDPGPEGGPARAPEPEPRPEPEVYDIDPVPSPPAEPVKVARPWTRSDDDVLPGRRGKGRRES